MPKVIKIIDIFRFLKRDQLRGLSCVRMLRGPRAGGGPCPGVWCFQTAPASDSSSERTPERPSSTGGAQRPSPPVASHSLEASNFLMETARLSTPAAMQTWPPNSPLEILSLPTVTTEQSQISCTQPRQPPRASPVSTSRLTPRPSPPQLSRQTEFLDS